MSGGYRPAMRRLLFRALIGVVVVLLVAAVGGYWYARPLLITGTGYAAHNACAVVHLAGRAVPASDLPPNPLVPHLVTSVGADQARTTIRGVLAGQTAWYTAGYGCTLATTRPVLPPATPVSSNALATAATPTMTQATTALVAAAFGDELAESERTGLGTRAVVVLRDGQLVAERYAPGFTATTPQLGWSMSKSVTNLLVGRMVAAGTVRVDEAGLDPAWTDDRRLITVDQLLRMTSGLSWDETYDLGTPITRMLYGEQDMGAYVASRPLAHPPGTYQQYSSGSTTFLCSVLAARSGGADLPRRLLFAPLGLSSAVWEVDATGTPVCSSYLWATPRDWATIGQLALNDGVWQGTRLLPEGWLQRSVTVDPVATSEEDGYAAGWWANRRADGSLVDPSLPADTYSANGHDGQRLFVVPSAGLVVVRLGFSPGVARDSLRTAPLVAGLAALPR